VSDLDDFRTFPFTSEHNLCLTHYLIMERSIL